VAELAAQPRHGDRDRVTERIGVLVPHLLKQLLGADHSAVGGQQDLQDAELLPGQRDRLPGPADPAPDQVDGQIPAEHDGRPSRAAPGQRPDPRHQLGKGERLGQIVVGPQVQAVDPLVHRGGRRQHEDPGRGRARHQARAHRVAMHPGQVAIQHDDVIRGKRGDFHRRLAVVSDVDRHALIPQALRDAVRQHLLILDH